MKNKWNIVIVIFLAGLIGWGIYDNYSKAQLRNTSTTELTEQQIGNEVGIAKGDTAPDFKLNTLEGKEVALSDFRGKKVLLNFWASWCPPCRAEIPHMEKFNKEYETEDVVILAVNVTSTEKSLKDVVAFIDEYNMTFPIVTDTEHAVASQYRVQALPTSYLIDSEGMISDKVQGAMTYDMMKRAMNKMK